MVNALTDFLVFRVDRVVGWAAAFLRLAIAAVLLAYVPAGMRAEFIGIQTVGLAVFAGALVLVLLQFAHWPSRLFDLGLLALADLLFCPLFLLLDDQLAVPLLLLGVLMIVEFANFGRLVLGLAHFGVLVLLVLAVDQLPVAGFLPIVGPTAPLPRWPHIVLSLLTILGTVAIAFAFLARRQRIKDLEASAWLPELLVHDKPFEFDLTPWLERLAQLYGGPAHCVCLFAVPRRRQAYRFFVNPPHELDHDALSRAVDRLLPVLQPGLGFHPLLPETLRDMLAHAKGVQPLWRQLQISRFGLAAARTVGFNGAEGIMLVAVRTFRRVPGSVELARIDGIVDNLLHLIGAAIEARRTFMVEAREVARRDLHDGVLQSLAALRMRLLTILQDPGLQGLKAHDEIKRTTDIIALEQARLRVLLNHEGGGESAVNLVENLKLCVRAISLQWGMEASLQSEERAIPIDRESATNIEHLVREVIANAARHAHSKAIAVALGLRDSDLVLTVKDMQDHSKDDPDLVAARAASGPLNSQSLKQRLTLVNGRAYSEGLAKGALLAINIPLVHSDHA